MRRGCRGHEFVTPAAPLLKSGGGTEGYMGHASEILDSLALQLRDTAPKPIELLHGHVVVQEIVAQAERNSSKHCQG